MKTRKLDRRRRQYARSGTVRVPVAGLSVGRWRVRLFFLGEQMKRAGLPCPKHPAARRGYFARPLADVLKEIYSQDRISAVVYETSPFLGMLPKAADFMRDAVFPTLRSAP